MGQLAATPVADPKTGEILIDRNQEIDEEAFNAVVAAGVVDLFIRSPLTCQAHRGLCRMCYGRSPATAAWSRWATPSVSLRSEHRRAGHSAHNEDLPHREASPRPGITSGLPRG